MLHCFITQLFNTLIHQELVFPIVGVFKLYYGFPHRCYRVNKIVVCCGCSHCGTYGSNSGYDFVVWVLNCHFLNNQIHIPVIHFVYIWSTKCWGHYHLYSCPNLPSLWMEGKSGYTISTNSILQTYCLVRSIHGLQGRPLLKSGQVLICHIVTVMCILVITKS